MKNSKGFILHYMRNAPVPSHGSTSFDYEILCKQGELNDKFYKKLVIYYCLAIIVPFSICMCFLLFPIVHHNLGYDIFCNK